MKKIVAAAGILLGILVISGQSFAQAQKKEEKKEYRGEYRSPAWMDNEHIICVRYTDEVKKRLFGWFGDISDAMYIVVKQEIQFVSMDINGENEKLLKSIIIDYPGQSPKWREEVFKWVRRIGFISYCPQRELIAFGTNIDDAFVISLDGKVIKVFKESGGLRWSPDGSKLLYCSGETPGVWIWDVAMDKSYKFIENAMRGVWSPDGKRIMFSKKVDKQLNVFLYDLETKQETPVEALTKQRVEIVEDWSPDGKMLSAPNGIYTLDGIYQKIPNTAFNDRWSPDGKYIVGDATEGNYISVVNSDGTNFKILR